MVNSGPVALSLTDDDVPTSVSQPGAAGTPDGGRRACYDGRGGRSCRPAAGSAGGRSRRGGALLLRDRLDRPGLAGGAAGGPRRGAPRRGRGGAWGRPPPPGGGGPGLAGPAWGPPGGAPPPPPRRAPGALPPPRGGGGGGGGGGGAGRGGRGGRPRLRVTAEALELPGRSEPLAVS